MYFENGNKCFEISFCLLHPLNMQVYDRPWHLPSFTMQVPSFYNKTILHNGTKLRNNKVYRSNRCISNCIIFPFYILPRIRICILSFLSWKCLQSLRKTVYYFYVLLHNLKMIISWRNWNWKWPCIIAIKKINSTNMHLYNGFSYAKSLKWKYAVAIGSTRGSPSMRIEGSRVTSPVNVPL